MSRSISELDLVLMLVPNGDEASRCAAVMRAAGLAYLECRDMPDLRIRLSEGAGALLLTDDVLVGGALELLTSTIEGQPSWSDVPIVLLSGPSDAGPGADLLDRLGNVVALDRPVRVTTLVSALRTAVRSRRRQYELRDQLRTRALYATIVESSEDAMLTKSADGTILSWNPGAERLFGYTATEAVGRPITLIVPPALRDEEASILDELRAGARIAHYETVRQTKSGERVDVSLSLSPIHNDAGQVIGASSVARDITLRKRSEAALRRQTDRLRLLWEAAAVLLVAEDLERMMGTLFGRIAPHFGLDVYLTYTLTDAGDALRLESSAGLSASDRERAAVLQLGESVSGTVAARRQSMVLAHIRGSENPLLDLPRRIGLQAYVANPLIIDSRLIGTLSFGSRTRERFESDELEFFETICHYVTATMDRMRLIRQLREADRRKDEFLATLAHELRNPLAPIRNALTIVRLRAKGLPGLEQARALMERQLEQMVRLIDDLLDVSRITRGKLELRKERVALETIIGNALDTTRPLIDSAGHAVSVSLPSEPVYLDGDPIRLAQVFGNLLNNAAKYMERGGAITVDARVHDGLVSVHIRDTGIGIPAEALATVFEMFTQVGGSGDRTQGGLGIGLTLVRRLVEMHGGTVEARSGGLGRGAEFITTLPVAPVPAPSPSVRLGDVPPEGLMTKWRILVADDNIDSAESMAMMLRLMGGNEVRTVHDGVQAVEEAEAFRPDLILLDIGMPRMNGYEAARKIRQQSWGQETVLVALTGWGQEEDRRQAAEAGFNRHFTKPVDPLEIEKLVVGLSESHVPSP
jgi:PAS domain S-box-containing protein